MMFAGVYKAQSLLRRCLCIRVQSKSFSSYIQENIKEGCSGDIRLPLLTKRSQLKFSSRIVVKLGSAVLTREDNKGVSLGRLASIIEQVAECHLEGREVMIITSGAVTFGFQKLTNELLFSTSVKETLNFNNGESQLRFEPRTAAAVGQCELISLHETMFGQYGITVAQILISPSDIENESSRKNLVFTLSELMALNIVPVINTNDAVSSTIFSKEQDFLQRKRGDLVVKDNDSLAALLSVEVQADLLILMSDVDGVYNKPPLQKDARIIWSYSPQYDSDLEFGVKSRVGTGGMDSKVKSAIWAYRYGVNVIICSGMISGAINTVLKGEKIGTYFTGSQKSQSSSVEGSAKDARLGSCRLLSLSNAQRAHVIRELAGLVGQNKDFILENNQRDIKEAKEKGLSKPIQSRLLLTVEKLEYLVKGLDHIADASTKILGRLIRRTRLAKDLELHQVTVPLGVLLVIFESRPDTLLQIAALSIGSANGLLLKGGKEAKYSNCALVELVKRSLKSVDAEKAVSLISSREDVNDLLSMSSYIDLVIPRGSAEMVKSIQRRSNIPVLGHSEGICHIFADIDANIPKLLRIVKDSKCGYPTACNAVETLLIHDKLLEGNFFAVLCHMLKKEKVQVNVGPNLSKRLLFSPPLAKSLRIEYGDLECCIELVKDVENAVNHINEYGSGHTDVIVTENETTAKQFLSTVNSACAFHNASSRFADGFRFGLGGEVGISTEKIHARGPVGLDGLLTSKWILFGRGHTVADFSENGSQKWLHEHLPL